MAGSSQDPPSKTGVGLDLWRSEFPETHWSQLLAGTPSENHSEAGFARLCGNYWYPIYAYLRRRGYDTHSAQDLTQDFIIHLLRPDSLARLDPREGRFRSYLLGSLNHFLADELKRRQAAKRGGGCAPLPIDHHLAEEKLASLSTSPIGPDSLFDQAWSLTVVEQATESLRMEYENRSLGRVFEAVRQFLSINPDRGTYRALAAQLEMSEEALRAVVSRMRKRFRVVLRCTVAKTVASPAEVDEELAHLLASLLPR